MAKHQDTESKQYAAKPNEVGKRRDFLRKAAVGSALVTTIVSRPAWATKCSISGNMSNNVSNQGHSQPCHIKGCKPQYWCNEHIFNYLDLSPDSPLTLLFKHHSRSRFTRKNARIRDCLPYHNGDWKRVLSNKKMHEKDLWMQRAAGALNALLWQTMLSECEYNSNCDFMTSNSPVSRDFYFPWTLDDVMSKEQYTLESTNIL